MVRILIAEDEPAMLEILTTYFHKEGFQVLKARNGEEAIGLFEQHKIDLAILDWMMPKIDGMDVCRYVKENSNTKVLMLTAKSQSDNEVSALLIGADDYMKKPFDPRVLMIRAKKLLDMEKEIQIGPFLIDTQKQRAYKNGEEMRLTKNEMLLFMVLIKNRGIILSREKLIDLVWGMDYDGDYRTVDTHIRRLRSKIGEEMVQTYRGIGYSLEVEED